MTILATKTCVTCAKPCYPTERLMVSDLWVHKAGCMKVGPVDRLPLILLSAWPSSLAYGDGTAGSIPQFWPRSKATKKS
jgi:hypothetical protein